jgi:acyl carrier protein
MPDTESIIGVLKTLLQQRFSLGADLEENRRLIDMGIDSLHLVDVLLDLETELDFQLVNLVLPPQATLAQLADAIAQGRADAA